MNPLTGGPCQGIRNLDRKSQNLGIYREVVSLDEPTDSFLGKDDFPIHTLGPGKGPWHYSPKLIPWLIENLERFDIVILNGLWLYPSYAVWKAIRLLKRKAPKQAKVPKIFIMPHGMLDPWFQDVNGREWKALRNWLYWKLIEKRVVNDADGLLFTCETELILARKTFKPYHPKQEINVGYGVEEPPLFSNLMQEAFLEKCPTLENQSYILFLSRIHYKKGVDNLIKAYENLLQAKPALKTIIPKLVIAGPGLETPYGQTIFHMVSKNTQLTSMVSFSGMLSGDAKWGAMYGCEAFILPSHQENFGIAVVEALACGKPVLISNQVNIWREIKEGNGGIVEINSVKGTEQLLKNWINLSSQQKELMGQQAKMAFEKHFHVKQAAIRMHEVLASYLK